MGTTFGTIRDRIATVLEATTPSGMRTSEDLFRYCPEPHRKLREWATDNPGTTCLRKFDITRPGDGLFTGQRNPDEVKRDEVMMVTLAYPREHYLYGEAGLRAMDDVMRRDARTVHDVVQSPSTLVTDWSGVLDVTILAPEQEGDVWFQSVSFRVLYCEAATYT